MTSKIRVLPKTGIQRLDLYFQLRSQTHETTNKGEDLRNDISNGYERYASSYLFGTDVYDIFGDQEDQGVHLTGNGDGEFS